MFLFNLKIGVGYRDGTVLRALTAFPEILGLILFPLPTCQLTATGNSISMGYDVLSWPPRALYSCVVHTYILVIHK